MEIVSNILFRWLKTVLFINCVAISFSITSATTVTDIPNPVTNPSQCHRNAPSYVCNLDRILTELQADSLDQVIRSLHDSTQCPCSPSLCQEDNKGYVVGIAVIQKMDLDQSDGNNMASQLDMALSSARNYAFSLLKNWNLGRCNEGVLIFFSNKDNVFYTAVDTTASHKLTADIVGEIATSLRMDLGVNLTTGLTKMVNSYRAVFLNSYNRTTNWQSSGKEPKTERLVINLAGKNYYSLQILAIVLSFVLCIYSQL